jgi:hypothetical protein
VNDIALDDLVRMGPRKLRRVFEAGHTFDVSELPDSEYHGVSLGLPRFVERLTWKKFKKVFHRNDAGAMRGWNVRVVQNQLDEEWCDRTKGGLPITYGHFSVDDSDSGVVLDYGVGGGVLNRVRDPLVSLRAGSTDRLLGYSGIEVLGRVVWTPSFFLLERGGPCTYEASNPST